jgi:hypothetical protein
MTTDRVCGMSDCSKRVLARGLCESHYYKAKRAGTLAELAPNPSGPCEHCGGEIPSTRRWGAKFCSTACKQGAADDAVSARLLAARTARPRFCGWCQEPLSDEKRANARFCSVKCGDDWHNHQKAAVTRQASATARKPCEVCGGQIPGTRQAHAVYCSVDCKSRARLTASPQARVRKFDENLRAKYGVTTEDYQRMLAAQDGRCAICGTNEPKGRGKRLHVDHCHTGGQVRGLLCVNCNNGLGNFADDPARLAAAVSYLGKWEG